jgi:hypothetical protein
MRIEIPLRALLRGGPDLEGKYVCTFCFQTTAGTQQALMFPKKIADLINARVAQLAGRNDARPKLDGVINALCAVGVDEDMAKDIEEYLVDKYSLASKHPKGLNMIPGGREGIRSCTCSPAPERKVSSTRKIEKWLSLNFVLLCFKAKLVAQMRGALIAVNFSQLSRPDLPKLTMRRLGIYCGQDC